MLRRVQVLDSSSAGPGLGAAPTVLPSFQAIRPRADSWAEMEQENQVPSNGGQLTDTTWAPNGSRLGVSGGVFSPVVAVKETRVYSYGSPSLRPDNPMARVLNSESKASPAADFLTSSSDHYLRLSARGRGSPVEHQDISSSWHSQAASKVSRKHTHTLDSNYVQQRAPSPKRRHSGSSAGSSGGDFGASGPLRGLPARASSGKSMRGASPRLSYSPRRSRGNSPFRLDSQDMHPPSPLHLRSGGGGGGGSRPGSRPGSRSSTPSLRSFGGSGPIAIPAPSAHASPLQRSLQHQQQNRKFAPLRPDCLVLPDDEMSDVASPGTSPTVGTAAWVHGTGHNSNNGTGGPYSMLQAAKGQVGFASNGSNANATNRGGSPLVPRGVSPLSRFMKHGMTLSDHGGSSPRFSQQQQQQQQGYQQHAYIDMYDSPFVTPQTPAVSGTVTHSQSFSGRRPPQFGLSSSLPQHTPTPTRFIQDDSDTDTSVSVLQAASNTAQGMCA